MNSRPLRLTTAAVTLALLGLGSVACSGSSSTAAAPAAPAGQAVTADPASRTTTHAAAVTQAGAPAANARCHTGELRADVQIQPDRPGAAMVMLVNKGSRTCTVDGYLGYGGLLADNSRVELATTRVPYPGKPTRIALKPGTTAFSGLSWSACDKADASCKVLAGLVVTPPDETTQLTAKVLGVNGKEVPQLLVSAAGLRVGSLQPSNQGVLLP
ncbi:DUF4232 domain-containing protein [Kitasatospora sp. GP82]|uniref:DUF4232 domain-containing protein n=1 Tax=Kitasatospora sp. GP82 TaxID=3035089 RepID=UPI0024760AEB|nr:DUF4232 domain-containing protein [Kitasatospora sp. GP82]MDH6126469.1 hypothetical protein [Kitasatospora sp. GP82]